MLSKLRKYVSLTYGRRAGDMPRIMILFVTSTCNQHCGHCFYAGNLNQKKDLTLDEFGALSRDLERVETILFSGGEPFLRADIADIAAEFYDRNGTRKFSIPTNGTMPDRTIAALKSMREKCPDAVIDIYFSFDGMEDTHNEIRAFPNAFQRSMDGCGQVIEAFHDDPRLRFQITSTVMDRNVMELAELSNYVMKRFRDRLGVSFGLLRGDPKDDSLKLPPVDQLLALHRHTFNRYKRGSRLAMVINRGMLELKIAILEKKRQVVLCLAGDLLGVVYDDGRVASCEILPSVGNVRDEGGFKGVWKSMAAERQRESIRKRECECTHECFISPSLLYHKWGPMVLFYWYAKGALRDLRMKMKPGNPVLAGADTPQSGS